MTEINPVVFTKIGAKLGTKTITVTPRGGFLFSSGFVHEENLADFTHCLLGYDAVAKAICFQFTNDEKIPGAMKLAHHKPANNKSLLSGAFFKFNRIDPQQVAAKYLASKENIPNRGQWFVIFLKEFKLE